MRKIVVSTIPHERQAYETVGNYTDIHGTTLFTISDMENEVYERLVFLHEFVEETLCRMRQIPFESIDAFDQQYEANRPEGDDSEPGHHPAAPYHREHEFAECLERMLAYELGVDWDPYDHAVRTLSDRGDV